MENSKAIIIGSLSPSSYEQELINQTIDQALSINLQKGSGFEGRPCTQLLMTDDYVIKLRTELTFAQRVRTATIENHVKQHYGDKVLADMKAHTHHVLSSEDGSGNDKHAQAARNIRQKYGVEHPIHEEVEQIDEISSGFDVGNTTGGQWKGKTSPSPYKNSNVAKSGIRKGMITKSAINRTKEEIKSRLNKEEVEQIEERTLSSKETKKKEEVVKSMKKKMGEFRKRYGSRGKEVMYATATKVAKGKK